MFYVMMFYYKIACIYFGKEDYENCIIYLDKIPYNDNGKIDRNVLISLLKS